MFKILKIKVILVTVVSVFLFCLGTNISQLQAQSEGTSAMTVDDYFQAVRNGSVPDVSNEDHVKLLQFYMMQNFESSSGIYDDSKMRDLQRLLSEYPELSKKRMQSYFLRLQLENYEHSEEASRVFKRLKELYTKIMNPDDPYWRRLGEKEGRGFQEAARLWIWLYGGLGHRISDPEKLQVYEWAQKLDAGERLFEEPPVLWKGIRRWAKEKKDPEGYKILGNLAKALTKNVKAEDGPLVRDLGLRKAILYDISVVAGFASQALQRAYRREDGKGQIEKLRYMVWDEATEFRQKWKLKKVRYNEQAEIDLQDIENLLDKGEENLKKAEPIERSYKVRNLSLTEAPFRSALAFDCATNTYFAKALDPAYQYFTRTYDKGRSSGHVTVVMGKARMRTKLLITRKEVNVAMVDKIQNIPLSELEAFLEVVRRAVLKEGYLLGIPSNVGDENGLSNDTGTREYVEQEMESFVKAKRRVSEFVPESRYDFDIGHSRAEDPEATASLKVLRAFDHSEGVKMVKLVELPMEEAKKLKAFELDRAMESTYSLKEGNKGQRIKYIELMRDFMKSERLSSLIEEDADKHVERLFYSGDLKIRKTAITYFFSKTGSNPSLDRMIRAQPDDFIASIQNLMQTPEYSNEAVKFIKRHGQLLIDGYLSKEKAKKKWLRMILRGNREYINQQPYYRMLSTFLWDTDFLYREIDSQRLNNLIDFADLRHYFEKNAVTPHNLAVAAFRHTNVYQYYGDFNDSAKKQGLEFLKIGGSLNDAIIPPRVKYMYLLQDGHTVSGMFELAKDAFSISPEKCFEVIDFFESQKMLWSPENRAIFYAMLLIKEARFAREIPGSLKREYENRFLSLPQDVQAKAINDGVRGVYQSQIRAVLDIIENQPPDKRGEYAYLLEAISKNTIRTQTGILELVPEVARFQLNGDQSIIENIKTIASKGLLINSGTVGDPKLGFYSDGYIALRQFPDVYATYKGRGNEDYPQYLNNLSHFDKEKAIAFYENLDDISSPFDEAKKHEALLAEDLTKTALRKGALRADDIDRIFERFSEFKFRKPLNFYRTKNKNGGRANSFHPEIDHFLANRIHEVFIAHLAAIKRGLLNTHFSHRLSAITHLCRVAASMDQHGREDLARFIGREAAKIRHEMKLMSEYSSTGLVKNKYDFLSWAQTGKMPDLFDVYGKGKVEIGPEITLESDFIKAVKDHFNSYESGIKRGEIDVYEKNNDYEPEPEIRTVKKKANFRGRLEYKGIEIVDNWKASFGEVTFKVIDDKIVVIESAKNALGFEIKIPKEKITVLLKPSEIDLTEAVKLKERALDTQRKGLQNTAVAEDLAADLLALNSVKYLEIADYLRSKGVEIRIIEGNIQKGQAYIGKDGRTTIEIFKNADGMVSEFVVWKEAYNALIIEAIRHNPNLGSDVLSRMKEGMKKDMLLIGLALDQTQDFTLEETEKLMRDGMSGKEAAEILKRLESRSKALVRLKKDKIRELAGLKAQAPKVTQSENTELEIDKNEKTGSKREATPVKDIVRPSIAKRRAGKTASLGHTILFITVLEIANEAKMLGEAEGKNVTDLTPDEIKPLIKKAAQKVVTSPEIFSGMIGSTVAHKASEPLLSRLNLKPQTIKAGLAQQAMGVVTFAGWLMASQLYVDATEGLEKAHDIRNIIGDQKLANEIGRRLKEHIRSGKYMQSFESAIFDGLLSGDTVFFLGFAAAGAKTGGSIGGAVGTFICPGIGTTIGFFIGGAVGGLVGAVSSVLVSQEIKTDFTDLFANFGKWWGNVRSWWNKGQIESMAENGYTTDWMEEHFVQNIEEQRAGRNRAIKSILGIYLRNLQLWYAAQRMLQYHKQEARDFKNYKHTHKGRALHRVEVKRKRSYDPNYSVSPYGNQDVETQWVPVPLTNQEIAGSIDADIDRKKEDIRKYKKKVFAAHNWIVKRLDDEMEYYAKMSSHHDMLALEYADLELINDMFSDELDVDKLAKTISDQKDSEKLPLMRAFNILNPLFVHGFEKERMEEAIAGADAQQMMIYFAQEEAANR